MHVSLSPSVPPRSWVPTRAGDPLYFTPLRPAEGPRFASGSGLKLTQLQNRLLHESGQRKKSRPSHRSYLCSSAKRQCSATGRCFALSLTAGAPPQLRARSSYFALDFSLRTRAVSRPHTDLVESSTGSVWRFHVPRIWIRSINGGIFPVKRKTQNVVDVCVLRLFVVVLFPSKRFPFNSFRHIVTHATLFVHVSS
jgi:hypothetical protein